MANWTFRCYDDGKGKQNLWQRWYDENPEARGRHDGTLTVLVQQERWEFPNWRALSKDMKDLSEIRFDGKDKRAWRVFGYTDQKAQEFTVLAIGYHQAQKYTPSNVMSVAKKRWLEIKSDSKKVKSCERPKPKTG